VKVKRKEKEKEGKEGGLRRDKEKE
jgi:hypothetical protein